MPSLLAFIWQAVTFNKKVLRPQNGVYPVNAGRFQYCDNHSKIEKASAGVYMRVSIASNCH